MQKCPICGKDVTEISRYPGYICRNCESRLVDISGEPIEFYNEELAGFGCIGLYKKTRVGYDSNVCYVDGIECYAEEAHFGGIVIQKRN